MTCFLIDDDLDDQEFFSIALSTIDPSIECVIANDGLEALAKLRSGKIVPTLFFLDMRMPRLGGAETIREIKRLPSLSTIPTILYSTSDPEIGNAEAKKAGADYFFTKPTSIPELAKVLEGIINRFARKV